MSNAEHLLQAAWSPASPAPKGERTEPSIHTTTSDVTSLERKLAAASDRPGSEREHPSMKVVIVKFGGVQGGADEFFLGGGACFSCNEKNRQEGLLWSRVH